MKPVNRKDWDDIVKEPMSEGLKARTMARARQELDGLKEQKTRFSWVWLLPILPALGALVLFIRQRQEDESVGPQIAETEYFDELTDLTGDELDGLDHELLVDLELLDDLDVLEEWDGTTES